MVIYKSYTNMHGQQNNKTQSLVDSKFNKIRIRIFGNETCEHTNTSYYICFHLTHKRISSRIHTYTHSSHLIEIWVTYIVALLINGQASCTMDTGSFTGVNSAGVWRWPLTPFSCRGHARVELYLYSPYGSYGLYRASVPIQGCTLPLPLLIIAFYAWTLCCLTFRRRIKSRLPFSGIIRRLPYSKHFQDKD